MCSYAREWHMKLGKSVSSCNCHYCKLENNNNINNNNNTSSYVKEIEGENVKA
jgi:hypothetical protein